MVTLIDPRILCGLALGAAGRAGASSGVSSIRVLPEILASQVAAGEVVERPASVVKELVENSLDAGAGEVLVEIRRGGAALIRVADDGGGMTRDDALMALERHATSKLREVGDLRKIRTLGFRGEAVPSIASVSRFRLLTRTPDALAGTEIQVEGGKITVNREAGCAPGTLIEARDLFFNIPARRKFLRTETTESAHVEHQLRLHALAATGVRFRFRKDEREVFDLPAGMARRDRVRWMLGTRLGGELIDVPETAGRGLSVGGFLLPGGHARKGRRHLCVFLNGRPVDDPAISRGLVEGFGGGLADGLHPTAWLWMNIDPELVDVNVHPAKREIRLHRPHDIRETVARAVAAGLDAVRRTSAPVARPAEPPENAAAPSAMPPPVRDTAQPNASPGEPPSPTTPGPRAWQPVPQERELPLETAARQRSARFRHVGELLGRYALLESEDGLVLLDPRAARERILYERWLAAADGRAVETQPLLVPEVLEPGPREADLLLRHRELFADAGFELEDFGHGTLRLGAVPVFCRAREAAGLLTLVADELAEGARPNARFALERLAKSLARRAAILEAPDPGDAPALLEQLFACDLPYCGADGRPTLTELSLGELERRFGQGSGSEAF